ncbi:LysR family transcriptional regulator [Rhodovibrionaceae bacterium A322]
MRVRNLDTFYWIATLGGFRAAADKLNLTQPAISARIQVLEQDLGAEVFVREVRNAELTADGRRLLAYAERYMALEQEVLTAFSDSTSIEQTIRVGASETIVTTWLPDFMGQLGRSRRRLSFDLSVDSTDNLRNALVAREIDLAFLMGPVAEVSVTNQEICAYEMICAAPRDLAKRHDIWSLEEVAQVPVLTFANNTKPSRQIREMLTRSNGQTAKMTTSASLGALIRMAQSNMGICAVPRAVVRAELESGDLEELQTDFVLPSIAFTASYVSQSPVSDLMRQISLDVQSYLESSLINKIYQK